MKDTKETYDALGYNEEEAKPKRPDRKKSAFLLGAMLAYVIVGVGALAAFLLLRRVPPPEISAIVSDPVEDQQVVGIATEPEPKPEPEPEPEPDPYEGMHFYKFVTSNRIQRLHVRREPGMKGIILERLKPGTPGYVLYKGLNWSYLVAGEKGDIKGYSFNYYLDLEEIKPEELPEDYLKDSVELQKKYKEEPLPGTEEPGIIGSGGKGKLSSWPYDDAPKGKGDEFVNPDEDQEKESGTGSEKESEKESGTGSEKESEKESEAESEKESEKESEAESEKESE